jgi:D-alanyl-D-alanine carboxypeptidase
MKDREPTFEPGTSQAYSNTNGLLLGEVIREVTGKPLAVVLEERIVEPLGLEHTYLYGESSRSRPRARGYNGSSAWGASPGEIVDCSHADEALPDSADGSIVASARDLLRYHLALRGGDLIGRESWAAMRHVAPGTHNGLAYLIGEGAVGRYEGSLGRAMGHQSASLYLVDRDVFVVLLVNRGDGDLPLREFIEHRYGP